jgi:cell division protein FtsL
MGLSEVQKEAIALGKEVNRIKQEIEDYKKEIKDSGRKPNMDDIMIFNKKYDELAPKLTRLEEIRKLL